jgi:signal transduction histidine kinase
MLTAAEYSISEAVAQPCEAEPPLADAFSAFSEAARSLERSYYSLGEEVRRLRSELEQERELRLRREALAQMAALVAHEVRNPLGSIELFADLLASSELSGEQREWVEQVQSGLRILSASVNNVLEFHSPSSSKLAPTDVPALLHSLEKFLRPLTARSGIDFVVEIGGGPLPLVADQQRLTQAFLNIALNAVRFAADGGVLHVVAFREDQAVVIQFKDCGPGISERLREKIFEPGVTTRSGGPGLGMAVAKRIVEQHRGTIRVANAPGRGTIFQIRLPQAGEQ